MATLNTLRTKGGIIVTIVIGLSLVAFLLTDIFSAQGSMFNSKDMRVGQINGYKINYVEFSNDVDSYNNIVRLITNKDALSAEEQDAARQAVWDDMMMVHSFTPGLQDLGIVVGSQEQIDMTNGTYLSPIVLSMFRNPQTGVFDYSYLKSFVDNMSEDPSGNSVAIWQYIKKQMVNQRVMSKFMSLVEAGIYTTTIQGEQSLALSQNTNSIDFLCKEYSSVPDSTIKISNGEIKKYYESHKDLFKQQIATNSVEYVVFDLLPSENDYAEAKKYIDEVYLEFKENSTPMEYAALNSQVSPDNRFLKESQIDADIAAALFNKPNGFYGPVLKNDTYTLARLSEMRHMPDTIGAKHILLEDKDQKLADSIITALKSGGSFAELSAKHSIDQVANQRGGDLGLFSPDEMIPEFSEACMKRNKGEIFTIKTQYGIHIVELTQKSAPILKAQIAQIKYKVDPSATTEKDVYDEVSKFYVDASKSYDDFVKTANENAISKRAVSISAGESNVNGLEDSREMVRWSFNAEKGDVSSIMELGEKYVVAAIVDKFEKGVAPLTQVAPAIKNKLIQDKKASMFIEELKGKPLAELTSTLGEIKQASEINFDSFFIPAVGVESRLIGAVSVSEPNKLSKPVKGDKGVYVFVTSDKKTDSDLTIVSQKLKIEAMIKGYYLQQSVFQAMSELSNIEDNRSKFF